MSFVIANLTNRIVSENRKITTDLFAEGPGEPMSDAENHKHIGPWLAARHHVSPKTPSANATATKNKNNNGQWEPNSP